MSTSRRIDILRFGFALSALLCLATGAAAQPVREKDETARWVPAVYLFGGAVVQDSDGAVLTSETCPDPPGDPSCRGPAGQEIRPAAKGDDLLVTPFIEGGLEVMTPGLQSVPGRPRLFAHGGAAASFAFTRDVAKEGVPDDFALPPNTPVPGETQILGQGSTTSLEVKPLLVTAGLGVAFTFEVGERRFRIKPSLEYLREEIEIEGEARRVLQAEARPPVNDPFPPPNCGFSPPGTNDRFRCIVLKSSDTKTFHGIGPSLEFEADAVRTGPFMMTVYFSGTAYRFLGDNDLETTAVNEFGENAIFIAEKERWGYRGGVGVRFRWLPTR